MARIGFGEVAFVLVLLLVLTPDILPKIARKLGRYLTLLRKLTRDVQDEVGFPPEERGLSGGGAPHVPRGRHDGGGAETLATLDAIARDYNGRHAAQVLPLALDEDPQVREKARAVLMLDPLFAFERRRFRQPPEEPDRPLSHLEEFFRAERVAGLSDLLNRVPDDRLDRHLEGLCGLPGVESLDAARIFSGSKEKLRERFQASCSRAEHERYPPQISVAPSYRCNARCEYCFTRALEERIPAEMTPAGFSQVLDKAEGLLPIKRVGLLGGEPTLASHVEDYVEELEKRRLRFYFATNGLAPAATFRRVVSSNRLEMVTVHVEKDGFYGNGQIDTLLENIAAVNQDTTTLVLRYNLSDKDNRDWGFLRRYLRMMERPGVSFAVVFPSRTDSNTHVSLQDLEASRPKILSLVRCLDEATEGRPRTLAFAKPYPLCLFDEAELQFLLRTTRLKNICEIDRNSATNNICINADASFFPCMALNSEEYRFADIGAFAGLQERYRRAVHAAVKTPLLPRCRQCLLHARGVCQAACYAYIEGTEGGMHEPARHQS